MVAIVLRAAITSSLAMVGIGCGMSPGIDGAADPAIADGSVSMGDGARDRGSPDAGQAIDGSARPYSLLTDEQLAVARTLVLPASSGPPADPSNAFADDPAAAALGQSLFFDPRFAGALRSDDNHCINRPHVLGEAGQTGRVACAGCHLPGDASGPNFVDTRSLGGTISLAADWVLRRTPTIIDVAQSHLYMWDARRDTLHSVVFGAIESPREMNSSRLFYAQQVFRHYRTEYEAIFGAMPPLDDGSRFPALDAATTGCHGRDDAMTCHGMPGDDAEFDSMDATPARQPDGRMRSDRDLVTEVVINAGKTMAAYMRRLGSRPGRFDRFMAGEEAFTDQEQRGLGLFVGEADCVRCHQGPYFSDHDVHNIGLEPGTVAAVFVDLDDVGASAGIAALLDDPLSSVGIFSDGDNGLRPRAVEDRHLGAFRTPMLRGHGKQPSFFHTGLVRTLRAVVEHFARGGDRYGFPGHSELADERGEPIALGLEDDDIDALVAFLETLDGPAPDASLMAPITPIELPAWRCP